MQKEEKWFVEEMPEEMRVVRNRLVMAAGDFYPGFDSYKKCEDDLDLLVGWAFNYGFGIANELDNFDKGVVTPLSSFQRRTYERIYH